MHLVNLELVPFSKLWSSEIRIHIFFKINSKTKWVFTTTRNYSFLMQSIFRKCEWLLRAPCKMSCPHRETTQGIQSSSEVWGVIYWYSGKSWRRPWVYVCTLQPIRPCFCFCFKCLWWLFEFEMLQVTCVYINKGNCCLFLDIYLHQRNILRSY